MIRLVLIVFHLTSFTSEITVNIWSPDLLHLSHTMQDGNKSWFDSKDHIRDKHLSWTQTWGLQDVCQPAPSIHVNPTVATVLVWQPVETGLRICLSKTSKSTGWSRCCIWLDHIDLTMVGNYLRLAGCAVWNCNNETEKTSVPLHPHPGEMIEKTLDFCQNSVSEFQHSIVTWCHNWITFSVPI